MNFIELYEKRYSSRDFDSTKPVSGETMKQILKAAQAAPSGCNAQPWKILVLESEEALALANACTPCIYHAPAALLFCYDAAHPDASVAINDVDVGLVNTAIAATHVMLAAAEQGLATCWVCWFDGEKTRQLFQLPPNWKPACFMPIGYPLDAPSERHFARRPPEALFERL